MHDIHFSGTLGDAFIVLCKIYNLHKKTGKKYKLYRYSSWPEMDIPIMKLIELFDYIEYPEKCRTVKNKYELINILTGEETYINPSWNGYTDESWNKDPEGISMDPFPNLGLNSWPKVNNLKRIGIQLHSGKSKGNFKAFSFTWLDKVLKYIPANKYEIHIYGTGDGLKNSSIKLLTTKYGLYNHVGKTDFKEWIFMLAGLDFLITPEGFSAFFAMSQRVKTLAFYTDYQILGRVHPEWRKGNILMSAGWRDLPSRIYNRVHKSILGQYPYLAPIKPEQVYSLMHSEFSYLDQK